MMVEVWGRIECLWLFCYVGNFDVIEIVIFWVVLFFLFVVVLVLGGYFCGDWGWVL